MYIETFKHFKYEIALDQPIPMPKPPLDYYPDFQFSVQQFLFAVCKLHIGSLGKKEGKWAFGPDAPPGIKLSSHPEIIQIFDYAEKMGVIVPKPPAEGESAPEGGSVTYQLSQGFWNKFDKYAQ